MVRFVSLCHLPSRPFSYFGLCAFLFELSREALLCCCGVMQTDKPTRQCYKHPFTNCRGLRCFPASHSDAFLPLFLFPLTDCARVYLCGICCCEQDVSYRRMMSPLDCPRSKGSLGQFFLFVISPSSPHVCYLFHDLHFCLFSREFESDMSFICGLQIRVQQSCLRRRGVLLGLFFMFSFIFALFVLLLQHKMLLFCCHR